ncbi:methionyl-tRNA formyltransferase [candidate division WOR-1 bacterium RIFCSPLOWO2_12_FULL_45_9]|uniref:Methionyl-tRNA formyltransferase n=1 Tax=candidate division WOR-1 bacterium RIFCSPLOWO2_12_FULL_45_9 TaxID=1802568 RepID=A0A1F4RJP2_UNCSA|nr:MAG: methionyl-tRNA formyltransferase [candidate division WOR-1 bacterium RIFCSPLOWO2_12_FULL_45_9]
MRIVFMGTPEPAAKILQELISAKHEILCVVTQPDRPKGRGQKMAFSPVKELALKHSLSIEQAEKIKGNRLFASLIKSLKPDIIVVVAYGKILPKEILDIPKHGCLNIHASLLPKYRGAAPIQWALLNGERETGVTIMRLDERLDTGDIIFQEKIKINQEDDSLSISKKLFAKAGKLLLAALEQIKTKKVKYIKQNDKEATFAPLITKESGELNWRSAADEIHNRIRAMVPWPGAHTIFRKKLLKIWQAKVYNCEATSKMQLPGTIVEIVKGAGFVVAASGSNILISEVQPEGKKRMSAYDFVIGYDVKNGEILPN